jgi:superoxide dismutase, Cu-Zn family
MIRNPAVAALLLSLSVVAMSACSSAPKPSTPASSAPTVQSSSPSANPAGTLAAHLKTAEGIPVADATFVFQNGQASVRIQTVATGILAPGGHEVHIHEIGKCEPNSVAPAGGPPGNFLSAGGHYQAPGHTGQRASGDLPPLEVRPDGSGSLQTTTDAFTKDQLLAGKGTALMIHGVGDTAMERVACGVIGTS